MSPFARHEYVKISRAMKTPLTTHHGQLDTEWTAFFAREFHYHHASCDVEEHHSATTADETFVKPHVGALRILPKSSGEQ